jgi:hypothetical protein
VPPGQSVINPSANVVQTLLAVRHDDRWYVALLQHTPAAFYGRPQAAALLTEELGLLLQR